MLSTIDPQPERTSRTSDEAVLEATGRAYEAWFADLDAAGATERTHGQIAALLQDERGVAHWWAQNITVAYEHARGLRPVGGQRDGTFTISASKTVGVPLERLYEIFMDPAQRQGWLPGVTLGERTSQPGRSARFDVGDDGSRIVVGFTAKGDGRSQVALTHERLPSAEVAEAARATWRESLSALKTRLEG
jgi:uncharacterized protein YndB with AHSA1/START domain